MREALRLSQAELSDAIEVLKAGRLHPEAVAELRVALLLEQIAVELTGPALANANAQQVQRDLARWTVQVEEALKSSTTRSAQTEVLSSLRAAASGPGAGADKFERLRNALIQQANVLKRAAQRFIVR